MTPTLLELRRVLGRALLVAPLYLGTASKSQSSTPKQPPPVGADAAIANTIPPDAKVKQCRHDPPDITGCGGAEVTLHDSLADCNLPTSTDGYAEIPSERCAEFCGDFETRSCHVY